MLKVGRTNPDFVAMLTDLFHTVWRKRQVPQDWQDAQFPKKVICIVVTTGGG